MHEAARTYVARFATDTPLDVIEIGSRNVNGGVRDLFPAASWTGVDIIDGPAVDVVADAATWMPDTRADLVVCCEVLEHTADWPRILANAAGMLRSGGRIVVTAAGPTRAPHSGIDGGPVRPDEHYANLDADELHSELVIAGFRNVQTETVGADVRATGVTP